MIRPAEGNRVNVRIDICETGSEYFDGASEVDSSPVKIQGFQRIPDSGYS